MRKLISIGTVIFLTACTTGVETFHNVCTQSYNVLAAQVACVKANVAENPSLQNDTLVQEYVRTGDFLVQQVKLGEVSEEQAQMMFVRKLNEMREQELRQDAARATIDRWRFPRRTDCRQTIDGSFSCTTF